MSVEVLLLIVLAGLTLLAYMIAINAHGPTRLGISYLLATLMLAGTVWVVVNYVYTGKNQQYNKQLEQLGKEKQMLNEKLQEKQSGDETERRKTQLAAELTAVITEGGTQAAAILRTDLQDRSVDFDGLVGRAVVAIRNADELKKKFEDIRMPDRTFPTASGSVEEGLKQLKDAAHYYRSFYSSEDSDQEELRARIMRQKARSAADLFQKAGKELAAAT